VDHEFEYARQILCFRWVRDAPEERPFLTVDDRRDALELLGKIAAEGPHPLFLREVLRDSLHLDPDPLPDHVVLGTLADAMEDGRLLICRGPDRDLDDDPDDGPRSPRTIPPPPTKTDFIEIILQDQRGRRIPFEAFEVTLPDGTIRTGHLDKNGFHRIDGIRPGGTCDVRFPEIHDSEWIKKS
jgi:hypothetical protein